MRRAVAGLGRLAVPVLLLAGCTAEAPVPPDATPSPFADCAALTTPPAAAAPGQGAAAATAAASRAAAPAAASAAAAAPSPDTPVASLPDLTLPCFTGGQPVRLRDVRGPVVLNVWQSACAPCRDELPAFQRLADRAGDRLHVLGVISRDSRRAAGSFGADLRITFPNVDDAQMRFLAALGRNVLPVTVFVAADGAVHVHDGTALNDERLAELVRTRLGVTV